MLRLIDDTTCVFDPQGLPISKEKTTSGFEKVWSIISDAFKYSNEDSASIAPSLSLKDFFREKLAEQTLCSDDQDLILLLAEMWGSFIGDPWERQSLKWFWLEECLDGGKLYLKQLQAFSHPHPFSSDNLFVAESHEAILRRVAESALINADIHLSTTVKSIESKSSKGEDPKVVVRTEDCNFEFDEVVVAVPLGCLKRGTPTLTPLIPPRISRAIRNASYSCLEKVYIAFPVAFWHAPTPEAPSAETKTFPSFVHFLHPTYVPEQQKFWTLELVPLSSPVLFGNQAQATLLFYMYGPCATHVTSLIRPFSPTSTEYFNAIDNFFRPYYSLLPNYKDCHPDCTPGAVLATDWQNDDLAGNGSYTNFQISDEIGEGEEEVLLDEDIRVLRKGLPERGIWFAGEHTAPFVALGTSTGAYWSGESAGMRILGANGLLQQYSDSHHTEHC